MRLCGEGSLQGGAIIFCHRLSKSTYCWTGTSGRSGRLLASGRTPQARLCRGLLQSGPGLQRAGTIGRCRRLLRQALLLKPDYAEVHNNLGIVRKEQGRLDEAVACYRQALLLKPAFADAHNNLGLALAEKGQLEDAVACYRQALLHKPDHAEAHNNLAPKTPKPHK